ncbi:Carbon-nitrogen hydrolase [Cohaesibacter sp. ES.047]|uniref:carbon-nitrogen hydrolase family protein n=1 Tax=Cohaesibacter sp. ES.047 TaxID=1798205 RepID=UPI000BB76122|nr:carbon-nitrogen hydrolase family protein [Cohaesibacter sp. ES.047]SNY94120.1 Carbon-nitrogen hydrolase [Cohaesibacter sp. ES.047]
MKLALYQGPAIDGDIDAAFAVIESQLSAAAMAGARMAVFPELYLPGYNQPALHKSLAQPLGGEWCQRLSAVAAQSGCGLTIGWAEAADGCVYNAATCFDAQGTQLAHHRKLQLFGPMEQASFAYGSSYTTFLWEGRKAALLICYDIEFPQHCLALAQEGVELVFVPTANPKGYEHVSDYLVPARASEMGLIIVYANYCGSEAGLDYAGCSLIAGPDAEMLATAGRQESLLVAEVRLSGEIAPEMVSRQREDYRAIGVINEL